MGMRKVGRRRLRGKRGKEGNWRGEREGKEGKQLEYTPQTPLPFDSWISHTNMKVLVSLKHVAEK